MGVVASAPVTAMVDDGTSGLVLPSCVAPELSVGITIAVLLVPGDHDTYSAREVGLFQG
jgi:hypothetical protein